MVAPTLAPRGRTCPVCRLANPEDVTMRIFREDGTREPGGITAARDYLRGVGMVGTDKTLYARASQHAKHITRFLEAPHAIAPMQTEDRVSRIDYGDDIRFPTVEQKGLNLGGLAMDELHRMISMGIYEDEATVVAAAKIGAAVAMKKADRAAKGIDDKLDQLARLAAGMPSE